MSLTVARSIEVLIELLEALVQTRADTMVMTVDSALIASLTLALVAISSLLCIQRYLTVSGIQLCL